MCCDTGWTNSRRTKLRWVECQAKLTELRWIRCMLMLSESLARVLIEVSIHCAEEEGAVRDVRGCHQLAVRALVGIESEGGSARVLRMLFGHYGGHHFIHLSQKGGGNTRYKGRWWM